MFRLGLLICDHVNESLRAEFDSYPVMFGDLFKNARVNFTIEYFFVVDGEFPENIDQCDAYMTSGSKSSVNDNSQWIAQLEKFIVDLYQANKPFVGICFGHQLIAKALGGLVNKSEKGWGVGIHTAKLNQQKDWMKSPLNQLNLVVSHQDQIAILPEDTQVLYSSEFCPFSMIQVGDNFLGVQGHPEFTTEYSEALMTLRKNIIPTDVYHEGKKSLVKESNSAEVTKMLLDFIKTRLS